MKSKLHFGLALGLITLGSVQIAAADEIRQWVAPAAVGGGTVASLAAINLASASISDRLEDRAIAATQTASNATKKGSLLAEKTRLEEELAKTESLYKESYADLQNQIAASHKIMKMAPGKLRLTRNGLPLSVDLAFKGTEAIQKKVDLLKKQKNSLEKQIAANTAHGDTTRALYHSALQKEEEARNLFKRSNQLRTLASISGITILPVTFATVFSSVSVSTLTKKAKAATAAANQSPPQVPTAPGSENTRAE